MSELGDEEESLSFYLKDKEENKEKEDEDEKERDKKEEEEILHRYEKIGNLKDIKAIKESELTKNYDDKGNKYYNEYQLIELLGKGAYSKVKLVVKDNVKYAMKIIDKKELKKKKIFKQDPDGNVIVTTLLRDALKEIAILKKLDHPNIIKLIEILHNYKKEKIYLILEYADYGDIVDYDEENNIFSINKNISKIYNEKKIEEKSFNTKQYYREKDITSFCKDIVLGLDYLHKNGIIHHDIKPNNILLCKKGICKITDFNFSSILENLNVDNIGQNVDCADHFKAPETLETLEDEDNNNEKNKKDKNNYFRGKPLDIWALGITIYIIAYLKFPFDSDKGIIDLYETIRKKKKRKTAEEIIKMCAVHKYDVLDKYKPIFKKRNYDINISNEEICMTLDFFHNECNAVFENPDDKSKPIILKFKKKLIRFELPKDRSLTKITIKENIHYVPIKPPIEKKSEGSSKTITTHIITTTSDDPMKSFTVKKTIVLEVDNNNRNSVKVTKHITTNGNGDKEVEDLEMEKKIMDDLQKIGNKDGKAVIQKYIAEK